jgi:hypothetical protein
MNGDPNPSSEGASSLVQGDQKVSVHLTITVQKIPTQLMM